ncbi:MAG: hypothetical protein KJ737_15650 [Proteobacteria bacterium]|nr:hypothetical protein [Pseudomonadota bacterium]
MTFKIINELIKKNERASCILLAVAVLLIDYITGKHIEFPIFYALPVGLAAWGGLKILSSALAVILPLTRVGFHFLWHETQSFFSIVMNVPVTILALMLYAYLVERTAWQTHALEKKVRILEGRLPICASCKKIRNEKGEYEQMEKYVTEHSEASFSHGICPDCAEKLYPDYVKKKNKSV